MQHSPPRDLPVGSAPQVACMQFINIVVHSVENMNFRVFLQYEFTHLGLDLYLEVSPASPSLGLPASPSLGLNHSSAAE